MGAREDPSLDQAAHERVDELVRRKLAEAAVERFLSDPDATLELFDPLGSGSRGLSVTWVTVSGPPEPTTERGGTVAAAFHPLWNVSHTPRSPCRRSRRSPSGGGRRWCG